MTVIRPIAASDEAAWRALWRAYLDFYGKTDLPPAHTDRLFAGLMKGEPYFAFVAEKDGAVIGFVHGLPHPSTWSETGYCYLEDLYVDKAARGSGAGRALINAVYDEAKRRNLSRVYWHTDHGNETARKLYDKVATLSDFVHYRMD
ncbi:GNAT family N-acetyltransferase [Hyphococcus luteus]|uniref:GNAT family N-acetyltransferase n=1 Tax=Hyphococcus luteus TaxID=2058213 RepID=A0A2S7K8R0_9PROT|nr:GNAT family N-acetyltransferase [Marinicaulis flavus]PQA88894.1 GNAT family N-acetyltransferase [Marinicaulis flavus]